jgi:hypothetical protein
VVLAGAQDQVLVLYYAVAVFVAFLAGLVAMTRYSLAEGSKGFLIVNLAGTVVVAFTLAVNLGRVYPLISLAAALAVAALLHWSWARAGRPRGIAGALASAERGT